MVLVKNGLNCEQVSLMRPINIENSILVVKLAVLIAGCSKFQVVFIAELYCIMKEDVCTTSSYSIISGQ